MTIKDLSKGAGSKIIKTAAPMQFWDEFHELESYICSNTVLDIFMLGGEVPDTVMSAERSDISQFCEHG